MMKAQLWSILSKQLGLIAVMSNVVWPLQAATHTVGRSAGWTIPAVGNVNYSTWAAAFTLSLGDVLVFKYDATLHDVLLVTMDDYNTCTASQPMAIYNTGETSITLDHVGTWCFICGVPGHCLAGQKLQVDVGLVPPSIAPSTIEEPSPPPHTPPLYLPQSPFPSPRASISSTPIHSAPPSLRPPLKSPYTSHISPSKASPNTHSPSSWAASCFPKLEALLMVLAFAPYLIVF